MTETTKEQLIVSQSMKIFDLELRLAVCDKNRKDATRGQIEYKEILEKIGDVVNYKGNYHNLASIIKEKILIKKEA